MSCNQRTCSLSPGLRLLLLLADTQGGWKGGRQLRECGKVGASHICTRARACTHTYSLSLSLTHRQKVFCNKLSQTNLPSDNP